MRACLRTLFAIKYTAARGGVAPVRVVGEVRVDHDGTSMAGGGPAAAIPIARPPISTRYIQQGIARANNACVDTFSSHASVHTHTN